MEEREIVTQDINEIKNDVDNSMNNEKGFALYYNLTMVSAVATVAMFVIGTAIYLTIAG